MSSPTAPTSRSRRIAALILTLSLAVLAVGCDDGSDLNPANDPGAQQPAAGNPGAALVEGAFADIPVPTAAESTSGEPNEVDGARTQSYEVTAESAESVMAFYESELPALGWTGGEREVQGDGYQAFWNMDGLTLLVASSPTPDGDDAELRLVLTEEGENETS